MRMQVEVRDSDLDSLRKLALNDHRSQIRDEASFLLHLKIHEELAKLPQQDPVGEVA